MKFKRQFTINQPGSPPTLYRIISAFAPSAVRVDDVRLEAETGEALSALRIAFLVNLCRTWGLKRSKFGDLGTYGYVVQRKYELVDYDACEWVCLIGVVDPNAQHNQRRDSDGRLLIPDSHAERIRHFGQVKHHIIIPDKMRQNLEAQKFQGIHFQPTVIIGRSAESIAPCWELRAFHTLAKLANTRRLMSYGMGPAGEVEPFNGDYSRMLFIDDPPYDLGEIHYRKQDIDAFVHLDVVETFERLWIPERSLIVSQRFYRYCIENEIPVVVRPVRVDS